MSNTIVTELVVDARGAEQGTAAYTRAMQAAQSAIDRMIDREQKVREATEKTNAVLTAAATSTSSAARSWEKLRAAVDPTVAAKKRIEQATLDADRAVRRGITTEEEAARTLAVYRSQLDGTANAARELARQQDVLARQDAANIAKVSAYMAKNAAEAAALTRAFDPLLVAQEKYNAAVDQANRLARDSLISEQTRRSAIDASRRALEAAGAPTGIHSSPLQRGLDQITTLRHSNGSARESASAFEEEARAVDAMAAKAARLRAELDPLAAAHARMTAEIESYQSAASRMAITQDDLVILTNASRDAFDKTAAGLKPVGEVARLTGSQVQNLGYQINDAATMLLSGSSPFQVIATQGGQVLQILQENGGVLESLRAIGTTALEAAQKGTTGLVTMVEASRAAAAAGTAVSASFTFASLTASVGSFLRMLNPTIVAITALGSGIAYLWYKGRDAAGDAEKAVDSYRSAIDAVKGSYDELGSAIEAAFDKQRRGSDALATARMAGSIDLQRAALQSGVESLGDIEGFGVSTGTIGGINFLLNSADGAVTRMRELYSELARGDQTVAEFQEGIARIRIDPANSKEAKRIADELIRVSDGARTAEAAINAINVASLQLKNERFAEFSKQLDDFIPSAKSARDRINEIADAASRQAVGGQAYDIDRKRKLALDELDRVETNRRAGYELDVQAIGARTAAEKADIAATRMRLSLEGEVMAETEKARRVEEARTLSLTQSQHDLSEAVRQRLDAGTAQVDQLKFEQTLIGRNAAETAQLRAQYDMLTAAKEAARQAGTVVDPSEEAAIRAQADEIGKLTGEMQRLNMERDLRFRLDQAGRTPAEQRIAEEVRSYGEDITTANGQAVASQLRYIASVERTADKLQEVREIGRDAILDIVDAFGSGEDAIKSVIGVLGNLGRQLASIGAQKVLDNLFGAKPGAMTPVGASIPGAISAVAGAATDRTYTAPVGRVERAPLAPLTVSLPSTASSTVARAGNAFLDLIRRAEGTSGANGYNTSLAYGRFTGGERNLTGMSLDQIDVLQTAMLRHPANDYNSSALGAYQIVRTTLRGLREELGLSGSQRFTPELQDSLALRLAERRGSSVTGLRSEWEGFHRVSADDISAAYKAGVNGTNVASSTNDTRAIRKGTSEGIIDANRQLASSYDLGGYDASPRAGGAGDAGATSASGGLSGLLKSPFGQGAMNALGAFGAGVSGGPLGGALTGGLGAIGMGLGPVGIVAGIGAGILGGLAKNLFNKKEREAAHRQAAAEWEQMLPAWRDYQERMKTGTGPSSNLRDAFAADDQALSDFMRVGGKAWKYGTENSTALHWQVGLDRYAYQDRTKAAFREGFATTEGGLLSGQGLEGPWAKARDAVRQASETMLTFVDDTKVAFGDAAAEVDRAKKAGIEQLRAVLRGADDMTEIQSDILTFEGAAAGLRTELVKLGLTSEEVARIVGEDLAIGMGKVKDSFEKSIRDRVDDLDGKGYLVQVRDFIDAFEKTQADAKRLGADTTLLPDLFAKQAQSIVDGAELTGDAFTDLIKAFPQLSGVVKEFVDTTKQVGRTAEEVLADLQQASAASLEAAKSQLSSVFQTFTSYRDGLRSFRDGMKLGEGSTLSQKDQLAEAQRVYDATLSKANAGDETAMGDLTGAAQDLLSQARDYFASSPEYAAIFNRVSASLQSAETKATSQIDLMRRSANWLEDISGNTADVAKVLADYLAAQKTVNSNRSWGVMADQNKAIVDELKTKGIDYAGNFGNGQFLNWVAAQLPSMQAIIQPIIDKWSAAYAPKTAMALGGIVGAYADGGMVGNGRWNVDSVLARYAGGGHIGLAGGEFVMPAPRVTPQTLPMLEGMRSGRMFGNDNSALTGEIGRMVAEIARLTAEVQRLGSIVYESDRETREEIRRGNALSGKTKQALERLTG